MKISVPMTAEVGGLKKLPKRGPMYLDLDVPGDGLTRDGSIYIDHLDGAEFYESLVDCGLGLEVINPRSRSLNGNVDVRLYGTKANLTKYLDKYHLEGAHFTAKERETFLSHIQKV